MEQADRPEASKSRCPAGPVDLERRQSRAAEQGDLEETREVLAALESPAETPSQ